MAITVGSRVRVNFDNGKYKQLNDPAKKFNGQIFTVKSKRVLKSHWLFELYGAESEYGIPYTFLEDSLQEIIEGDK